MNSLLVKILKRAKANLFAHSEIISSSNNSILY